MADVLEVHSILPFIFRIMAMAMAIFVCVGNSYPLKHFAGLTVRLSLSLPKSASTTMVPSC